MAGLLTYPVFRSLPILFFSGQWQVSGRSDRQAAGYHSSGYCYGFTPYSLL